MLSNISVCDWVLLGFLLLALFYGWRQGTVNVIGRVGSVVVAYIAARRYSTVVALFIADKVNFTIPQAVESSNESLISFLSLFFNTEHIVNGMLQTIISVVIFVVVAWLVRKIARIITSAFGRGLLGGLNRAVGAVLSVVIGALIIMVVVEVIVPALNGMGLVEESRFFADSQIVVPFLQDLRALL